MFVKTSEHRSQFGSRAPCRTTAALAIKVVSFRREFEAMTVTPTTLLGARDRSQQANDDNDELVFEDDGKPVWVQYKLS